MNVSQLLKDGYPVEIPLPLSDSQASTKAEEKSCQQER